MKKRIVMFLVLALCMVLEVTKADFTFGTPTNLGPVVNTSSTEGPSCLSSDGLELYFTSDRPGGFGTWDIWVTTRDTIDDDWGAPTNLGPPVNTGREEVGGCLSSDGLSLYFHSDRLGGLGATDLYLTTRETTSDEWGTPVNLGSPVNTAGQEHAPRLSTDGLELYFSCYNRSGGYGAADIWVTRRATVDDPWGSPVNLGPVVNSSADENFPFISADGLLLLFSEDYGGPFRPGGFGDIDIWGATRASVDEPWETILNLGPVVNSGTVDSGQLISPDGSMLYFCSERPGGFGGFWGDIYQARIIPITDLNGDGIVDSADMCIMVDNWGTDLSLCDVGPMPWGDGIVDVKDLIVLAEHLFEEYPPAESVEVSEADNRGQIELEQGQILVVTLESNPSTGYRWERAESFESTLVQLGQTEFKSSETSDPPIVGAGGWEIFRFRAVSAGQMSLLFFYHRSWEDAEPLKTFSIKVVVP